MLGEKQKWLKKKSMETCNLCQSPLTKTLPFGPLIALLGTCPKEVAGNLGGSIMQRPVPQSAVQNGRKCGHGLRQPGLSREGDSVAANPGAGRTRNNGLVYVLMLCGQTGPHRLISPTCPLSLWGSQGLLSPSCGFSQGLHLFYHGENLKNI